MLPRKWPTAKEEREEEEAHLSDNFGEQPSC